VPAGETTFESAMHAHRNLSSSAIGHYLSVLLGRNVNQFRGGLVFKAHRLVHHSNLGSRVIRKKNNVSALPQRIGVSPEGAEVPRS